jgi:chromosome segregation ATPase
MRAAKVWSIEDDIYLYENYGIYIVRHFAEKFYCFESEIRERYKYLWSCSDGRYQLQKCIEHIQKKNEHLVLALKNEIKELKIKLEEQKEYEINELKIKLEEQNRIILSQQSKFDDAQDAQYALEQKYQEIVNLINSQSSE